MSSLKVSLNTDADGFVSQACPACRRRFKVVFGEGSRHPIGFCPYCRHAGRDCWWTQEQATYLRDMVAQELVAPSLEAMARRINGRGSGMFRLTMNVNRAPTPVRPFEGDEPMAAVKFECCGERIKHEPSATKLYCVICGDEWCGRSA